MYRVIRQLVLGVFLLWSIAAQAQSEVPQEQMQSLPQDKAALSTRWQDILQELGATSSVQAKFREYRHFAMRKRPVSIDGEVRFSRERGLSLLYLDSGRQLIVDKEGILLRNKEGKSNPAALPAEATAFPRMLLALFNFDWEQLHELFEIKGGIEADAAWKLELKPRDSQLQKSFRAIRLDGTGRTINQITLDQGVSQRVEIQLGEIRFDQAFNEADKKLYFR